MGITEQIKRDKTRRRLSFFIGNIAAYLFLPDCIMRWWGKKMMSRITPQEKEIMGRRVAYYCRLTKGATPKGPLTEELRSGNTGRTTMVKNFRLPVFSKEKNHSSYFFALSPYVRAMGKAKSMMAYLFGDIIDEPSQPAFVKSRPIGKEYMNAVVMKLDGIRHFMFVNDNRTWREKCDRIVSRNVVHQWHRIMLLNRWFGHPSCDFGQVNPDAWDGHTEWVKPFMSIEEQLGYKFIMCTEGNDVATNLKWVMSSNSIAVMPKPRYETWYMEGTLVPDYHYIEVKPDYSDLIEKTEYYIAHPEEAEEIIKHAHEHVSMFQNKRLETATQLAVAEKYFSV